MSKILKKLPVYRFRGRGQCKNGDIETAGDIQGKGVVVKDGVGV